MPPKAHALLSASSSHRWLNCPPSARLGENYEDKNSDYAAEGTDAHTLCEFRLREALGLIAEDPRENLTWFNEEMDDCATGYAAYVLELVESARQACADPVVLIEQRVDFSRWVESGFGTASPVFWWAALIIVGAPVLLAGSVGIGLSAEARPWVRGLFVTLWVVGLLAVAYLTQFVHFGGFCLDETDVCVISWPARIASLLLVPYQLGQVTDVPFPESLGSLSALLTNTRFGILWLARMALWALVGVALRRRLNWLALALAAALLMTRSLNSHSSANPPAHNHESPEWARKAAVAHPERRCGSSCSRLVQAASRSSSAAQPQLLLTVLQGLTDLLPIQVNLPRALEGGGVGENLALG